jgi:hypothetical protein
MTNQVASEQTKSDAIKAIMMIYKEENRTSVGIERAGKSLKMA